MEPCCLLQISSWETFRSYFHGFQQFRLLCDFTYLIITYCIFYFVILRMPYIKYFSCCSFLCSTANILFGFYKLPQKSNEKKTHLRLLAWPPTLLWLVWNNINPCLFGFMVFCHILKSRINCHCLYYRAIKNKRSQSWPWKKK